MSEADKVNGETRDGAIIKPDLGRFKSEESRQRSLANLKPPFGLGNPGGARPRTKDRSLLITEVRKQLRQRCEQDPQRRTWAALITAAMIRSAVKGNTFAAQWLSNMCGGFPNPETDQPLVNFALIVNRNVPGPHAFSDDDLAPTIIPALPSGG